MEKIIKVLNLKTTILSILFLSGSVLYAQPASTNILRVPLSSSEKEFPSRFNQAAKASSQNQLIAVHIVEYKNLTPGVSLFSALKILRSGVAFLKVWDSLDQALSNFGERSVAFVFEGAGLKKIFKPGAMGIGSVEFYANISLDPLFTKVLYSGYCEEDVLMLFKEIKSINQRRISSGIAPISLEIWGAGKIATIVPLETTGTGELTSFFYKNIRGLLQNVKNIIVEDLLASRKVSDSHQKLIETLLSENIKGLGVAEEYIKKGAPLSVAEAESLGSAFSDLNNIAIQFSDLEFLGKENRSLLVNLMAHALSLKTNSALSINVPNRAIAESI